MLRDVVPPVEGELEPRRGVQHAPVHDGHEERQRDDGGVEEGVEGLQGAREC